MILRTLFKKQQAELKLKLIQRQILEQWIDEKTHRHKEGYCEIPVVKVDDDCPLQPITLPCWSLSALLSLLPFHVSKEKGYQYHLE